MHGEDRLGEALRSVGEDYLRHNPADLFRARTRVRQLRRRRQMRAAGLGAAGAVAIAAAVVFAWPAQEVAGDRPRPAAPAELPAGSVAVPVGDEPAEVAVGDGVLWVSNGGESTISRVDPSTNETSLTTQLSGAPGDLAVGDSGEVWVANPDLGAVQRLDPVTSATTPDVRVDVGPAGNPLDLAIDDFLWVSVVDRELVQVDRVTGEVVRRIESVHPVNVAARDGAVFVLESDGTVQGIDPLTGGLTAVELSFDVSGRGDVHFDEGKLWVAEGDGSELYSADVTAGSRRISSYSFRGTYMEMVHVPGGVLVLSDLGDGTGVLSMVDPVTAQTRELAEIPGSPRDLVRGDGDLWVTLFDRDELVRIPALP